MFNEALGSAIKRGRMPGTVTPGLQANNGSPMGMGQPTAGKDLPQLGEAPEAQPGILEQQQQSQQSQQPQQVAPPPQIQQPQVPQPTAQSQGQLAPVQGYGQYRGALEGFDANKMDSGHISPKYVYAQQASHYSPQQLAQDAAARAELLAKLQADPSGYFKNASFGGSKNDRLMVGGQLDPAFNGLSEFDIIRGAGEGGLAHQWGAINNDPDHHGAPVGPKFMNAPLQQAISPMMSNPLFPALPHDPGPLDAESANARLQALLAQLQLSRGPK